MHGRAQLELTLSGVAPSAISKGWGGLIGPPQVWGGCWGVVVSNFSDNLISYSDWHQTKGFTTFRYLEPPQLMVWKSDLFRGLMRFVRVPPYESGVTRITKTFWNKIRQISVLFIKLIKDWKINDKRLNIGQRTCWSEGLSFYYYLENLPQKFKWILAFYFTLSLHLHKIQYIPIPYTYSLW